MDKQVEVLDKWGPVFDAHYTTIDDLEPVIAALRKAGANQMDTIKVLRDKTPLGLKELKPIVDESATWKDRLAYNIQMRNEIIDALSIMTIPEIKTALTEKHQHFTNYLDTLGEKEFMYSLNGKWTAGQQLGHIYLSVKALNGGLKRPKLFLWYAFGKANRPSKTYDGLVAKYLERLKDGAVAPSPFIPTLISFAEKAALIEKLHTDVAKMNGYADNYSETQLDKYILPHPRLGKQTIREMLYFTIYHVEHHEHITKRNLASYGK